MAQIKESNSKTFLSNILDPEIMSRTVEDRRVRRYVIPNRIIWKTTDENTKVENDKALLIKKTGQITLDTGNACKLINHGAKAGILLDFGVELHGGIEILTWKCGEGFGNVKLRVRFGESAMEAMSEIGGEGNATNNHAVRDHIVEASCMGMLEVGNTGFRFVRIDLLDEDSFVEIKSVRAVFLYKDIEYKGSFSCSDELLNKIWYTGAYTVHLNMQNFVWDGIKRDRLVWIGDMHPEISTIQAVFGYDESVSSSLDLIRDETRLPGWMNNNPAYSMWWILIHFSWYMHNGDISYLKQQKDYLVALLNQLFSLIEEDGSIKNPGYKFIDWPSSGDIKAVDAGFHSLLTMSMDTGAKLCKVLDEDDQAQGCLEAAAKLRKHIPENSNNKQAAALMALAGLADLEQVNREVLSLNGAKRLSTFLGYYVLNARAMAGDIVGSLQCVREYWGGMLELGATTFWEDFNVEWMKDAARIDEIVTGDKIDVHGKYGDYCYKGYRHSLCHGWASGPTAWLSEYVLGIKVVEPGCKVVQIVPNLGDLQWAEGTYPTPEGNIYVKHEKQADNSIKSIINAPKGIAVVHKDLSDDLNYASD